MPSELMTAPESPSTAFTSFASFFRSTSPSFCQNVSEKLSNPCGKISAI